MADDLRPGEDPDGVVLAGELSLGLLEGAERAAAQRRRLSDPAFAALVADWDARLAGLSATVAPVAVSPDLWAAIEARLGDAAPVDPGTVMALRRQVARWRGGAAASAMAAAVAVALLLVRPAAGPVAPPATTPSPAAADRYASAQLSGEGEAATMMAARYDPATGTLVVRTEAMTGQMKPGMMPELWVIPKGGAPISLGQVAPASNRRMPVDPAMRRYLMTDGSVLAITIERESARPHAAPGSAPVATGTLFIV